MNPKAKALILWDILSHKYDMNTAIGTLTILDLIELMQMMEEKQKLGEKSHDNI